MKISQYYLEPDTRDNLAAALTVAARAKSEVKTKAEHGIRALIKGG